MSRSSEPLLEFLRDLLRKRNLNTAAVAETAGLTRARARKVLAGVEAMTVEELLAIGNALDLSPADFGLLTAGGPASDSREEEEEEEAEQPPVSTGPVALAAVEDEPLVIDAWGNHSEQLFKTAFTLGCDFLFVARASALEGKGVPPTVLAQYKDRALPIKLDAAFHRHNAPRFGPDGITLTLSFDALYECHFPWTAIEQVIFFPVPPEPVEEDEGDDDGGGPVLRLVT